MMAPVRAWQTAVLGAELLCYPAALRHANGRAE